MQRSRLIDFRTSTGPAKIGICPGNVADCAAAVNEAQQSLLLDKAQGDTGWYGSWARMAFNVSQGDPFITTPREVARIERLAMCNRPVPIQNGFYEFLDFGIGPKPSNNCRQNCEWPQVFERNNAVTFIDFHAGFKLRVYLTNPADAGKRVLVQGTDQNDEEILSLDGLTNVTGEFVTLVAPFVETDTLNSLTGLQKDITAGSVKFYEVNPTTGDQTLILTMEPGETTASYRRYYLNGLPKNCCNPLSGSVTSVQITAMAKLDFIPVQVDTDWLTPIMNIRALIEECQAQRFGNMDSPNGTGKYAEHHAKAIRFLQGEIVHYEGKDKPAITVAPFGSARLRRRGIGVLT